MTQEALPSSTPIIRSPSRSSSMLVSFTQEDVRGFAEDPQRLQQAVESLKRLLKEAEEDQRFRDAEAINLTLEALKSDVIKQKKLLLFAEYNHMREECENERDRELEDLIEKWELRDKEIQDRVEAVIKGLQDVHIKERDSLEEDLQRRLNPEMFKPSKQLIELRKRIKALVGLKRYSEAEETKEDIENLERKERREYELRVHAEFGTKQDRMHFRQLQQCKQLSARNQLLIHRHETEKTRAFKEVHTRYENQLQLLEETHNISQHHVEQTFAAPHLSATAARARQASARRQPANDQSTPGRRSIVPSTPQPARRKIVPPSPQTRPKSAGPPQRSSFVGARPSTATMRVSTEVSRPAPASSTMKPLASPARRAVTPSNPSRSAPRPVVRKGQQKQATAAPTNDAEVTSFVQSVLEKATTDLKARDYGIDSLIDNMLRAVVTNGEPQQQ